MNRFLTATLLAGAVTSVGVGGGAAAQTRTDPPKMTLSCWGYHVDTGRRYNCVTTAANQPLIERFLPAKGAKCNGSIRGYSQGRTGIQVNCNDDGADPGSRAWTRSGTGPDYFRKPASAVRVRITSSFSGYSENFIVTCDDRLIVNEIVGTGWGNTGTSGTYRMMGYRGNCTEVVVEESHGVSWSFRQLDAATAFSPPRYWSHVTGAGAGQMPKVLEDLATAVEHERSNPEQRHGQPPF